MKPNWQLLKQKSNRKKRGKDVLCDLKALSEHKKLIICRWVNNDEVRCKQFVSFYTCPSVKFSEKEIVGDLLSLTSLWGIFISVGKRSGKCQGNKKCQSFHCRWLCKWQSCFAFLQHTKTNNIFLLFQDFFGCEKISKNNTTKRTAATTIATAATATGAATITTGLSWCRWIFLRKLDRVFFRESESGKPECNATQ